MRRRKSGKYISLVLDDGRIIREHRYVMEQHLGRRLNKDEHVHHRNSNGHDNRLTNLELISSSKHSSLHNKSRPRKRMTKLKCVCGAEFYREERYVKSKKKLGNSLYCTRACAAKHTKNGAKHSKMEQYKKFIKANPTATILETTRALKVGRSCVNSWRKRLGLARKYATPPKQIRNCT